MAYINAICSHRCNNKLYLPRSVCHPILFLHVFSRNLDGVRLSLPRISPHPVCLSFELLKQHQSWSSILLFLCVHKFNSLPLQCCGNTQIPSQPVENTLQSYWMCNRCTYAYVATSRDMPLGAAQERLEMLQIDFRDYKRPALLQVWMRDKPQFLPWTQILPLCFVADLKECLFPQWYIKKLVLSC